MQGFKAKGCDKYEPFQYSRPILLQVSSFKETMMIKIYFSKFYYFFFQMSIPYSVLVV